MSRSAPSAGQSSQEMPETSEKADSSKADDSDEESVSANELFEILSNNRRRYTIHALSVEDSEWEIGHLAEQVAAWENEVAIEEVTRAERKSVYTSLQQRHLPRMDDLGIVEYKPDLRTVQPTAAKNDIDIYLDVVSGDNIPWHEYYLGLSAVSAGLVAVAWLDIFPFSLIGDIMWIGVIAAVFAVSSIVHYYLLDEMHFSEDGPPRVRE